jgi:hypothetical protein
LTDYLRCPATAHLPKLEARKASLAASRMTVETNKVDSNF